NHSRVLRVADADAAAVVYGNPGSARRRVDQRIQQRPIGNGIGAVLHSFGFAERRSHRPGVQMIAPDHDGSLDLAVSHQAVYGESEFRAFAVPEPADAGRKTLKLDARARQRRSE